MFFEKGYEPFVRHIKSTHISFPNGSNSPHPRYTVHINIHKNDAYYLPYTGWANKNDIVNGISETSFAPDQSITREQMAVIMAGYAKTISFELPQIHAENTFADNTEISSYSEASVKQMQMAGIFAGKDGNKFDPKGTVTRAEVSAVLKRFMELIINSNNAE